jgi:mono/diheme cytochrome c family protein
VFDGGARVLSGPSSLVATSGGVILLAGQFTDSVLAFDCAQGGTFDGTLSTGRGPRGMTLSSDGKTLFVDAGFDLAIDRVDVAKLAAGNVVQPDLALVRSLGTSRLSAAARRGRATFNDAVNTHITPSGVVTCASCHPGGGEDGVTWFFHTQNITARVRRTQSAWGGRPELSPFHWDGEFTDASDLAKSTTQELLGGDALLVQFDDVAAFMQEVPMAPPRPVEDAALVAKGKALFNDATVGCSTCHAGDLFADGKRHPVLPSTGDPLIDIAGGGADTPSLLAVRTRAPYLHNGSAPSLAARIAENPGDMHGKTSQLSADDRKALVAYLESL